MSDRTQTFVTTARILAGASTEVLLAAARERAPDPSVFDQRAPFFWLSEISNDRMDAYYGYMDAATTLMNFAADAAEGRAVLAAHNRWDLPFGYSLTGSLERATDRTRVLSDAYTLRGLDLGGVQTDSFIDGVRAGVVRDVSVGFNLGENGWYRCNVCGNDLQNYSLCRHWPGMTYEEQGADGVIRQVLATFTVMDGRLSEYSAVYDGATPSAGILKIQDAARAGELDERARLLLATRYRSLSLPDRRLVVPGTSLPPATDPTPRAAPDLQEPPMFMAQLREALRLPADADETAILAAARALPLAGDLVELDSSMLHGELRALFALPEETDPAAHVRALAAELPQLRTLAEEGRAYRTTLIDEALDEAVRALGAEAEDRYRPVLAGLPLATVRQMRDDWAAVARRRFPGGRITEDGVPTTPPATPAPTEPPAGVYRAG